jgi:hypothetical protein
MILIAFLLSAAAPAERWVHVGGHPNVHEEYVDVESIARDGDKVSLWSRRDLLLNQGTVWHELEFDCGARTETILAYIQDAGGVVSHNNVRPHREASRIAADPVTNRIFEIACN